MIPEIAALNARPSVIRIPNQIDVPVTKRVLRLIDTVPFQRLSGISQLGLVSYVYPGANHTRFEHSLGVYRNALLFARRLSQFDYFRNEISESHKEAMIVAALLHDIGHWPFCHPIEDIGLSELPAHEAVAADIIRSSEIAVLLADDWNLDPELVIRLVSGRHESQAEHLLGSIISGPIDIDKMDYLYRDSLHCGVPYGMNFDAPRLINSVCINQAGDGIAISSKGKTAAEMMVFGRYVMFSEVYWHHAVRSATAMLQRVFFNWCRHSECRFDMHSINSLDDSSVPRMLRRDIHDEASMELVDALFGTRRKLFKRLLDYNADQNPKIYRALSRRPFDWLLELEHRLAEKTGVKHGEIMIDAPPPNLEVQFKVEVNDSNKARRLEEISPVVKALAQKQFDDFVKRVRVFVHPRLVDSISGEAAESCLLQILQIE